MWEFVRIVKTMAGVGVRARVKNDGRCGTSWTCQKRGRSVSSRTWQAQVSFEVVFKSGNCRFVELTC